MPLYASWVHGNAITVEAPQNLDRVGHFGWGGDMAIKSGKDSWMHVPLPTPVIADDVRTKLNRVSCFSTPRPVAFGTSMSMTGPRKCRNLTTFNWKGSTEPVDSQNTFTLTTPHTVVWGIGISFYFIADIGFDSNIPDARLIVGAAGGDFFV